MNYTDWCKSSKTVFARLCICTWLNCSQGGCLAFQLAGPTVCPPAQICSESPFVQATNFDPNEPPTMGKLIGNEASQKSGFGNSDPH